MPRQSKPWYRAASDTWVSRVNRKLETLAKGKENEAEAHAKLQSLLLQASTKETARLKHIVVQLPLSNIQPHPLNDTIYKPVDPAAADIVALAESISANGLLESIEVTRDGFIISGHRRYVACRLAGLDYVDCRISPVYSTDPEFPTMLRERNRQRVKSFDEVVRESVIDINPDDAYQELLDHRQIEAASCFESIDIRGEKRRSTISEVKMEMVNAIKDVIESLSDHWPVSARQVHYELLNDPPLKNTDKPDSRYQNDLASYKNMTGLLTRMRLNGVVPFEAVCDETRGVETWDWMSKTVGEFLQKELKGFLQNYYRDLQQSQPCHMEIVGEKNTIKSSIHPIALKYCIPYTLARGYSSIEPVYQVYKRYKASGKDRLVLLMMTDFDPDGEDIAHSFARVLRDDFGVDNISLIKVCLTWEQVRERDLQPNYEAAKDEGMRHDSFVARYGNYFYELETLSVDERADLLEQAIRGVIDPTEFNKECRQEQIDSTRLAVLKKQVGPLLTSALANET